MHGALTHSAHTNFWWDVSTSTREFNNQQDTNNVWWLFCIDNPRPADYAQSERSERVKRIIISPISRIILFLLIPRTWPPWKFNISSYCRCFYVAVHHRVLFWLCASLLNTCTWEMDAFLLESHQYHDSLGSRRSGCRERVTRNVASGEHEGTLADKDYDSGLKSNDKGLELTKCTCTIFTFMMLFPLCSSLEITEITQFGAGRTAILMN